MKYPFLILFLAICCTLHAATLLLSGGGLQAAETTQYIDFSRAPGQGKYQGQPESLAKKAFEEVLALFPDQSRINSLSTH